MNGFVTDCKLQSSSSRFILCCVLQLKLQCISPGVVPCSTLQPLIGSNGLPLVLVAHIHVNILNYGHFLSHLNLGIFRNAQVHQVGILWMNSAVR